MYNEYFGLTDRPFSIAPDPRYLYMSDQHREALAHLMYGVQQDGGFILLTGEVGTGKTTVCRCFLKQLDEAIDVAYIVNPKQTALELLESMCDDLGIARVQDDVSIKSLTDVITSRLLLNHSQGKNTVLLIDEAQNLSVDVLEQLRLLTNLETDQKKLLQIILLGQPELLDLLAKPELRQLSQRVTARFHMDRLDRKDIIPYVRHRLAVAGCRMSLFPESTAKVIERASGGVPRLINLICDRTLLGVYSSNGNTASIKILKKAAKEVLGEQKNGANQGRLNTKVAIVCIFSVQCLMFLAWLLLRNDAPVGRADNEAVMIEVPDPVVESEGPEVQQNYDHLGAFKSLAGIWGIEDSSNSWTQLCDSLSLTRIACVSDNITWNKLEKINRPMVATVLFQGVVNRMLVTRLIEGSELEVQLTNESGETYQSTVSRDVFEQIWTGKVHYLWLQPQVSGLLLRPGDIHPYVQAVRGVLMTNPIGDDVYDKALSDLVRSFQKTSNVTSDGVIGPETIMLLNSISEAVPMLFTPNERSTLKLKGSDSGQVSASNIKDSEAVLYAKENN